MITTTQMYFLLRLDMLSTTIQAFCIISGTLIAIFSALLFIGKVENMPETDSF